MAAEERKGRLSRKGRLALLAAMGPGLLTALAGNDAGGIATYSSAGASYGFGMLWTVPIMCLLLIVVQETAARMGCATGKGFASLIREQFGIRISAVAMLASSYPTLRSRSPSSQASPRAWRSLACPPSSRCPLLP